MCVAAGVAHASRFSRCNLPNLTPASNILFLAGQGPTVGYVASTLCRFVWRKPPINLLVRSCPSHPILHPSVQWPFLQSALTRLITRRIRRVRRRQSVLVARNCRRCSAGSPTCFLDRFFLPLLSGLAVYIGCEGTGGISD